MPHSVEIYFDFVTDGVIRDVWQRMAPLSYSVLNSGTQPHLKLALYDDLEVPAMIKALEKFSKSSAPMDVVLPGIGVFPSDRSIVFLAPAMTERLLQFHTQILQRFGHCQPWEYCLPSRWVPHCVLARELPPAALPRVFDVCRGIPLPLNGRLEKIALVEFEPAKEVCVFELEGS